MRFVKIPAGKFEMISDQNPRVLQTLEDERVKLEFKEFKMSDTPVTNSDFKEFVNDTGYVTDAEKIGSSFVFWMLVNPKDDEKSISLPTLPWWKVVKGANWKHPYGPHSSIKDMKYYPVVHISRSDAIEFCKWSNTRLPSEAEWEYAARGGNYINDRPWGDFLHKGNKYFANFWQGNSNSHRMIEGYRVDSQADGYLGLAPVYTYEANEFGLYQTIGNVWEWCSNRLGVSINYFGKYSSDEIWQTNLSRSNRTYSFRGGCFMCKAPRVNLRDGTSADTSACTLGFRVIKGF